MRIQPVSSQQRRKARGFRLHAHAHSTNPWESLESLFLHNTTVRLSDCVHTRKVGVVRSSTGMKDAYQPSARLSASCLLDVDGVRHQGVHTMPPEKYYGCHYGKTAGPWSTKMRRMRRMRYRGRRLRRGGPPRKQDKRKYTVVFTERNLPADCRVDS